MGRIYLNDENKLVVETDNGKIDGNGNATTEIRDSEQYSIDPESIAKLIAMLNDVTTKGTFIYQDFGFCANQISIISKEEAVVTLMEALNKANAAKRDLEKESDINSGIMRRLERESYDRINKAKEMLKKAHKTNIISIILCGIAAALFILGLFS